MAHQSYIQIWDKGSYLHSTSLWLAEDPFYLYMRYMLLILLHLLLLLLHAFLQLSSGKSTNQHTKKRSFQACSITKYNATTEPE